MNDSKRVWPRSILFGLLLAAGGQLEAAVILNGTLSDADAASRVNRIGFTVATAGMTAIDVLSFEFDDSAFTPVDVNGDGEFAFFDPVIYLFADDGSLDAGDLIASNDDNLAFPASGAADGSVSLVDSFLEVSLTAGNYLLAIGAAPPAITVDQAIAGSDPTAGKLMTIDSFGFPTVFHDHGDYRITFSDNVSSGQIVSLTSIPEPTACALWAGLCVPAAAAGKRFRRALNNPIQKSAFSEKAGGSLCRRS